MIQSIIKLLLKAGEAKPCSSIGSSLGQKNININEFCRKFNSISSCYLKGTLLPVVVSIRSKGNYSILVKPPTVSSILIKNIKENRPLDDRLFNEIYKIRKDYFNTLDKNKIFSIIKGTLSSINNNVKKRVK